MDGEVAQLARACGSYPQCRRFKSVLRYYIVVIKAAIRIWLAAFLFHRIRVSAKRTLDYIKYIFSTVWVYSVSV